MLLLLLLSLLVIAASKDVGAGLGNSLDSNSNANASTVDPTIPTAAQIAADPGQRELTPDIPYNPSTPYGLPRQVHEFLEKWNWGDFHMVFHMTRKYYVIGDQGRQWLDRNGARPAQYQEGDPSNGLEFLCMHRAMIEYLRQRFGSVPVTNDPDGRATVSDVLDGWTTDAQAQAGLAALGGDVATFNAGLRNINNFALFKTEDQFGLFIQTTMRLQGTVDPRNPAARHYTYDRTTGAGVHNWLHGQLQDDQSPITVGDPRTNLPNILFWRIHGWIEAKWRAFQAFHKRTDDETQLYNGFMTAFRAHMLRMSEAGAGGVPVPSTRSSTTTTKTTTKTTTSTPVRRTRAPSWWSRFLLSYEPLGHDKIAARVAALQRHLSRRHMMRRVPWSLVYHLRSRWFRNHVPECTTLAHGTRTDNCPAGRSGPAKPWPSSRRGLRHGRAPAHRAGPARVAAPARGAPAPVPRGPSLKRILRELDGVESYGDK
jgi:hypothetical protein